MLAFVVFWIIGLAFVRFGERVLGGWPATEVGQFLSCVLGVAIALRMRAPGVAYLLAAMAAFSASELAIHLSYGLRAVQGAPTHVAVMGSGILGVALGALLMMRRRRTPGFGATAANGIRSHNAPTDADGADAATSERRSNLALQPAGARILIAGG
jgi:putative effector of murein hydrolase